MAALELDIDHRPDDLNDLADFLCFFDCCCHSDICRFQLPSFPLPASRFPLPEPYNAWAPETTSMISRVIAA